MCPLFLFFFFFTLRLVFIRLQRGSIFGSNTIWFFYIQSLHLFNITVYITLIIVTVVFICLNLKLMIWKDRSVEKLLLVLFAGLFPSNKNENGQQKPKWCAEKETFNELAWCESQVLNAQLSNVERIPKEAVPFSKNCCVTIALKSSCATSKRFYQLHRSNIGCLFFSEAKGPDVVLYQRRQCHLPIYQVSFDWNQSNME